MLAFSKKSVFVLVILLFAATVSATSVINADDWRTVTLAESFANTQDQETFTIATPADAEVAKYVIDNPKTLYNGESPTLKDFRSRTGLKFDRETFISPKNYTNNSKGFVVVKDDFGTDSVAVLNYAAKKNYSLVFYSYNVDLLNSTSKPKLFYGNFDFNPENKFANSDYINGSWQERNLEIVDRMESEWVTLSPRNYFDPDTVDNHPVLFKMNQERLAKYIDNSKIRNIKVTGTENTLYAKEIDFLTDKDLNIVVKTGRAFTGVPSFEGVYNIRKIKTSYRRYNLDLASVFIDSNSSKSGLKFVNRGNTVRKINLKVNNDTESTLSVPAFSSLTYTRNLSANRSKIAINYTTEHSKNYEVYKKSELTRKSLEPITDLDVIGVNYSQTEQNLDLKVRNSGQQTAWVMAQASETYDYRRIEPSESQKFSLNDIGSTESYTIFQGDFENQYSHSTKYYLKEENEGDIPVLILLILALVILPSLYVVYEFIN